MTPDLKVHFKIHDSNRSEAAVAERAVRTRFRAWVGCWAAESAYPSRMGLKGRCTASSVVIGVAVAVVRRLLPVVA